MKYRELNQYDVPELLEIEEASHLEPWSADVFERCFSAHYKGIGLEKEGALIGFVLYSLQAAECHILNLCVHPRYQRQGLGEKMLIHSLDQAKQEGAGMVFLEVRRTNIGAIALYHKLGFIQISVRKGYYPSGNGREDALVFAMDLSV